MIIGHKKNIEDLKKLVSNGNLRHGYLFFGPDGVGKKAVAMALANFIEKGEFEKPHILNDALLVTAKENSSIGIDESREIKHFLSEKPNVSSRRTVVVDGEDRLTEEAQNALLKIAEEPPASTLLILIVNDPEKLYPTLVSRLQKIYFGPLSETEMKIFLKEKLKVDAKKTESLLKLSFGRPGLAVLLQNSSFQELVKQAKTFLDLQKTALKPFLKTLAEDPNFDIKKFLDALIFVMSGKKERNSNLWHKVLELRGNTEFFALNPKIQLGNIWRFITKN